MARLLGNAVRLAFLLGLWGASMANGEGERPAGWRLTDAVSPYLRLHADNPVAWRPWGQGALEAARAGNKPLFLSIGYYTCHWCHVMERESFRDPAIAELLNEHYIPVKVDREQQPALDTAYQRFVKSTSGHGGWPLTVIATPQGRPFFGGTYFPPEGRDGVQGLQEVLATFAERWDSEETALRDKAREAAVKVRDREGEAAPADWEADLDDEAARALAKRFDPFNGGFGKTRKFPRAAHLLFLLRRESEEDVARALTTLDAMADSGLFDQVGGGFHRYAIDPQWRVPHFEKMLPTQALVARAYLRGFEHTGEDRYAKVARRTLDFALDKLGRGGGGFYAGLAAASPPAEGEKALDGAFYTWTCEQVAEALGDATMAKLAAARFGVTASGNAGDADLGRRNVLYRAASPIELSERFGLSADAVRQRLDEVREHLRRARAKRPTPAVDRKVISAWNGHMLTTLVMASRILEEPEYLAAARRSAAFIWERLVAKEEGQGGGATVRRSWTDGGLGPAGGAADYAALAEAALALHRSSADRRWRGRARRLLAALEDRFGDGSGGYVARVEGLAWLHTKPVADIPTPSANALAARAQLALGRQGSGERWLRAARATAAWHGSRVADSPEVATYLLAEWPALQLLAEGDHR